MNIGLVYIGMKLHSQNSFIALQIWQKVFNRFLDQSNKCHKTYFSDFLFEKHNFFFNLRYRNLLPKSINTSISTTMKKSVTTFLLLFLILFVSAQEKLDYYLPADVTYNSEIPDPTHFFNQELGEWHLTHDQLLHYVNTIAEKSNRASLFEYARSWENRPLVHLVFTSEKNQNKLEELKELHYQFSEPGSTIEKKDVPVVINLSYGVHGNESSASNSAVLTAYYLAAAQGKEIDHLLENTIVIVDPCMNPDGFVRHSTWANMHQSYVPNGDGNSRQFSEVWPGGRTNHYWFDLNRDYLLLVHPETKGKIKAFHEWKPNIVTDHHEMGSNSTFFFQPGVPSRNNPLTPERNYELTHKIAKFHAKHLDEIGSGYYSEEQFDDFYLGKGSAYPDVNGGIGILFEQGGYRGRVRETNTGLKTLAFGIKNQFTVSLSTLESAVELHDELLDLQKEFYLEALNLADKSETKAYVFGSSTDKIKSNYFIDFLNQHQIDVYGNLEDITINNTEFEAGSSYLVPVHQKQYRMLTTLFEEVTSFSDTTFYDVSTWTFTHAFNLPSEELSSLKGVKMTEDPVRAAKIEGQLIGETTLAYVFRWDEYTSAQALYRLQNAGLFTKVATDKFVFTINEKEEKFAYGTILIPLHHQKLPASEIEELIEAVALETGIDFYGLPTGLSPTGIDMGSSSFVPLNKPEILLFVGDGISSRDAGEIWHLFDQRYKIPLTLSETSRLRYMNLNRYNTIILAGSVSNWSSGDVEKISQWVKDGGNLIAYKSGTQWAAKNGIGSSKFVKSVEPDTSKYLAYSERRKEWSINYISGAILNTEIDITHPLCYGYTHKQLPVFKSGTSVAQSLNRKYVEPVKFSQSPYLSGWVSDANLDRLKNAPVVSVQPLGRGKLFSYHDNMNFRGIWLGTSKLFSNAVFFGSIIR